MTSTRPVKIQTGVVEVLHQQDLRRPQLHVLNHRSSRGAVKESEPTIKRHQNDLDFGLNRSTLLCVGVYCKPWKVFWFFVSSKLFLVYLASLVMVLSALLSTRFPSCIP